MKFVGLFLAIILLCVGIGALEAYVIMLLWNNVVCAIFSSLPILGFWATCGILVLVNLLLSAFKIGR